MSLVSLLISKLRIREFPGDSETNIMSILRVFKAEKKGSKVKEGEFQKYWTLTPAVS